MEIHALKPLWIMVAGPIAAETEEKRAQNIQKLTQAALEVARRGHVPIFAHHLADPIRAIDASPERQARYLKLCGNLTERCDAILILGHSPGADLELRKFEISSKPVYWDLDLIPSLASEFSMRSATQENLSVLSSILNEAADWIQGRGPALWTREELSEEQLRSAVDTSEYYLAFLGEEPIGAVKFQWKDELFWPDIPQTESAFIHKLAVRRSAAKTGLSRAIVTWAENRARENGKKFFRLDTDAGRPKLCAFYESLGFTRHSFKQVGPYHVARYEKRLSEDT